MILLFGTDAAVRCRYTFFSFFLNLARALGFTHSGGCESQTALPPVQSLPVKTVWESWTGPGWDFSSCLCGVSHSLELSLWVLHHLRVLPSLASRFQGTGRDKDVTMMKQCDRTLSSSLYGVSQMLIPTWPLLALG